MKDGYGVYLRKVSSTSPYRVEYIDLTDYVSWETGNTQLDIGDLQKRIGEDMRFSSAVTGVVSGTRQTSVRKPRHPDTLVEGDLKLTSATVQDDLGRDNAIIFVQWEEPTYDNGSPVQNGLQYQVEWKPTNTTGDYQSSFINWNSTNDFTIEGLQLNTTYDVRVVAVLTNANTSDPATGTVTTALDTNAPSKPGPAATIAAGALRVQIIHNLGRAEDDEGNAIGSIVNFTLERDTHHLNVYASTTSGFSLSTSNDKEQHKVGELSVGSASIKHQIPVVGEVQMPNGSTHYFRFTAVDNAGNESSPSDEQSSNGNLVASANISDAAITTAKISNLAVTDAKIDTLTAGKITAGTIAGQEIIVGTNTSDSAVIKSSNYSTGSAGWKIDSDGTVEFESGTFRGNLDGAGGTFSGTISANQISGGSISADLISGGSISADLISGGTISADLISGGTINGSNITVTNLNADNITTGSLNGNQIENNAISSNKIQSNAVTNDKIDSVEFGKVTAVSINAGTITAGTLNVDRIPNLNADKITSGTIDAGLISTASLSSVFINTSANITSALTVQGATVRATGNVLTGDRLEHNGASNTYIDIGQTSSFFFRPNGGTTGMQLSGSSSGGSSFVRSHWKPNINNTFDLGSSGLRWDDIYTNGSVNTSDITLKTDVENATLGLDFIETLTPIEFKWKDGGVRTHLGFSAQDVKQKLIDYAGDDQNYALYTQGSYAESVDEVDEEGNLIEDLPEDFESYGLRYDELIPPLTKAIQELSTQISDLTARVESLEE